jgi:hypothetical protein
MMTHVAPSPGADAEGKIMAAAKTLNIVNYFAEAIDAVVTGNDFNCCDSPRPGQVIGRIPPNGKTSFVYQRTDGHGCNGRQGQFQLSFESRFLLDMDFDADANIEITTAPTTFGAFLNADKDGNYTLVVGAEPG